MSTESKLTIDQSVKMDCAINRISAILQTTTSACWGEDVDPLDLPYLFAYALDEVNVLRKLYNELEGVEDS